MTSELVINLKQKNIFRLNLEPNLLANVKAFPDHGLFPLILPPRAARAGRNEPNNLCRKEEVHVGSEWEVGGNNSGKEGEGRRDQ